MWRAVSSASVRLPPDDRRAQILDVARRLFRERPYGEVATTDIAREAGVARGLLHHYFGTKRDLYMEVAREIFTVPEMPVPDRLVGRDADDVWAESLDRWLDLAENNREAWLTALRAAGAGADAELSELLEQSREAMAARTLALLGVPDTPSLRARVRACGAFAETVTVEWLDRGRLTRAEAHALLHETALHLLRDHLPPRRNQ